MFDYPCRQEMLVFSQTFRPIVGPIQPHPMGTGGGVVCPGGETDHLRSCAEVKCVCSCTAPLVSVINPRDRLRQSSKNNSAFSGSASMSSLSPLLGVLAQCHKVLGCGSYGTSGMHLARAETRCEAALKRQLTATSAGHKGSSKPGRTK